MVYSSCDVGRDASKLLADPVLDHARSVFPGLAEAIGTLPEGWWRTENPEGDPSAAVGPASFKGENFALRHGLRETEAQVRERCMEFRDWAARSGRGSGPTAVVTHACFMFHMLGGWYENCEVVPSAPQAPGAPPR